MTTCCITSKMRFDKIKKIHIDEITDYNINVDTKGLRRSKTLVHFNLKCSSLPKNGLK